MTAYIPGAAENVVRLKPISHHGIRPLLSMEITFCDASQPSFLQSADGRQVQMTMGDILRRYNTQIASIEVDATRLSNLSKSQTIVPAVHLPFVPYAVALADQKRVRS